MYIDEMGSGSGYYLTADSGVEDDNGHLSTIVSEEQRIRDELSEVRQTRTIVLFGRKNIPLPSKRS